MPEDSPNHVTKHLSTLRKQLCPFYIPLVMQDNKIRPFGDDRSFFLNFEYLISEPANYHQQILKGVDPSDGFSRGMKNKSGLYGLWTCLGILLRYNWEIFKLPYCRIDVCLQRQ